MLGNNFFWLPAIIGLAHAMLIPSGAENGLWVTADVEKGEFGTPICLDFAFQSVAEHGVSQHTKRRQTFDKTAWPWPQATSYSIEHAQQLSPRSKAGWLRRRMSSQVQQHRNEGKSPELSRNDNSTTRRPSLIGASCGHNQIIDTDLQNALRQMADYCDQSGFIDAYQHVASKWGSTLVYICARGHAETCRPEEFLASINYLHNACAPESGWIYNNYLYPDRPASKYGMDALGADFC